jgi:hypothetical protein
MLTRLKVRDLHNVAQSLRDPADFREALRVILSHHPRIKERRLQRRTAQVAAFQAMTLDERAAYIEKRKSTYASQRAAVRSATEAQRQKEKDLLAKLRQEALDRGVTPLFFHYHLEMAVQGKDGVVRVSKRLFATTCVLVGEDQEPMAKGVSLVSMWDNPGKLEGRIWAIIRALKAEEEGSTSSPVGRSEARWIADNFRQGAESSAWANKCVFMPDEGELTQMEIERMEDRGDREATV